MSIFLGNPPYYVNKWIYNMYVNGYWNKIVYNLERLPTAKFVTGKTEFNLGELPAPGTSLLIDYMTRDGYYDGDTFVPTLTYADVNENLDKIKTVQSEWVVLGYNGHVPKYVKYMSKNGAIFYVSSTGDGTTRTDITVGAAVYMKIYDGGTLGNVWLKLAGWTVTSVGSETFTYGQTNVDYGTTAGLVPYSVPLNIKINDVDYTFCGYTMALNSKHTLCTSSDGSTIGTTVAFNSSNENDWGTSELRTWLNTWTGADEHGLPKWNENCAANGLKLKLAKQSKVDEMGHNNLLMNTIPVINRVWNYDESKTEDVEDTFFLMSNAEVNCSDMHPDSWLTLHDYASSLASFDVFKPFGDVGDMNTSRFKHALTLDGGSSSELVNYWLRSVGQMQVGSIVPGVGAVFSIDGSGMVLGEIAKFTNFIGCSPAFVLG